MAPGPWDAEDLPSFHSRPRTEPVFKGSKALEPRGPALGGGEGEEPGTESPRARASKGRIRKGLGDEQGPVSCCFGVRAMVYCNALPSRQIWLLFRCYLNQWCNLDMLFYLYPSFFINAMAPTGANIF